MTRAGESTAANCRLVRNWRKFSERMLRRFARAAMTCRSVSSSEMTVASTGAPTRRVTTSTERTVSSIRSRINAPDRPRNRPTKMPRAMLSTGLGETGLLGDVARRLTMSLTSDFEELR